MYKCVYIYVRECVCLAKWWQEKQIHLNRELCVCFALALAIDTQSIHTGSEQRVCPGRGQGWEEGEGGGAQ